MEEIALELNEYFIFEYCLKSLLKIYSMPLNKNKQK